jgi:branched-chain amino acid transport system ATP-binding protein
MPEVEGIHTAYGTSRVLFGISLEIKAGECVGLLGRNGMGKTTTMRSIMGLTPPWQGRVRFKGRDITTVQTYELARRGIDFVPENRRIFAELTVEVAARSASRPGRRTTEAVVDLFPKLGEIWNRLGGVLSGGEQQMLTIARTLMGNPELLLLDEPSEGLALVVVANLLERVQRLKREGLTILLAEQGLEFSLALADRVYVLEKGAIRHAGAASEQRDDPELRNRLLAL